MAKAKTPAQGGNEITYLNAFLDARVATMKTEEAHSDVTRVEFLTARPSRTPLDKILFTCPLISQHVDAGFMPHELQFRRNLLARDKLSVRSE